MNRYDILDTCSLEDCCVFTGAMSQKSSRRMLEIVSSSFIEAEKPDFDVLAAGMTYGRLSL